MAMEASTKLGHWLVKFAPFRTPWPEVVKHGAFTLRGARSHAARKNLVISNYLNVFDPKLSVVAGDNFTTRCFLKNQRA